VLAGHVDTPQCHERAGGTRRVHHEHRTASGVEDAGVDFARDGIGAVGPSTADGESPLAARVPVGEHKALQLAVRAGNGRLESDLVGRRGGSGESERLVEVARLAAGGRTAASDVDDCCARCQSHEPGGDERRRQQDGAHRTAAPWRTPAGDLGHGSSSFRAMLGVGNRPRTPTIMGPTRPAREATGLRVPAATPGPASGVVH
jgi:hypothetical protein